MSEWLPWAFMAALACFGMGWLVARIDIKQLLFESRTLPRAYFSGLNFLMTEQPDKAIDAFIEVSKQQPEAVELQFALGTLLRKRGEVDRAIRIHQSLAERLDLPALQRRAARFDLALDFRAAGLLENAEGILLDLTAKPDGDDKQHLLALGLLRDIHAQERNWPKAIAALTRMRSADADADNNARYATQIANYHCEAALLARQTGRAPEAAAQLELALAVNTACVRANLLKGEWLAADDQHVAAITVWQQIEKQNPAFLGLMADQILASFEAIGKTAQGLNELRALQQHYPALDMFNAIFHATMKSDGALAAREMVKAELRQNPTLVGLDRLLEAELLAATDDSSKADIKVQKDLVHAHSSRLAVYLCGNCGFKAKQFYWQCPACAGWETFPPRRTAEYDTSGRHLARMQAGGLP